MHGGKAGRKPTHGRYTREAIERQREMRELMQEAVAVEQARFRHVRPPGAGPLLRREAGAEVIDHRIVDRRPVRGTRID